MSRARTTKQKAASRRNLIKARAVKGQNKGVGTKPSIRAVMLKDKQFALSGGTSKFVYLGTVKTGRVGSVAKIRPGVTEKSSVVRQFGLKTGKNKTKNAAGLKSQYESFLKGKRVG